MRLGDGCMEDPLGGTGYLLYHGSRAFVVSCRFLLDCTYNGIAFQSCSQSALAHCAGSPLMRTVSRAVRDSSLTA